MKFLLTGSAGFIGFHLTKQLLADGHEVIGIDSMNDYYDPLLKEKRNEQLIAIPGYTFYQIDIAETESIDHLVAQEKPDQIIHLAAQAGVRYSLVNPWAYERSNVLGTMNIFESAKKHQIKRVIFASSSSVYGKNAKTPFAESDVTDSPVSLYAATKKSCELIAHTYHHLYGTEIAGLRFFTVYGTYYRPDMALFMFAKNILTDQSISVFNHGKMKRDFTHVSDIVDGIKGVIEKEKLGFEIYNLGGDHPVGLEEMIGLVEKGLGKTAIKNYQPMQAGDVVETCADITKARNELNFDPKVKIEDGIEDYCKWFLENQDWLLKLK